LSDCPKIRLSATILAARVHIRQGEYYTALDMLQGLASPRLPVVQEMAARVHLLLAINSPLVSQREKYFQQAGEVLDGL
jgi:hypothetical protein